MTLPVTWPGASNTEIALITERERTEPMAGFVAQLRRFGFTLHVLPRCALPIINRVATPHIALLDVLNREYQAAGDTPSSLLSAWDQTPLLLVGTPDELARIRFGPSIRDLIALPIHQAELDVRIRFTLWRTQGSRAPQDVVQVDVLRMNTATYEVFIENRRVDLTYKEFELLKFFVTHRRRVFSRPELLEQVWETDYFGGTRTVDVHIRRLRAKLGPRVGDMIQTVRNVGYRFG